MISELLRPLVKLARRRRDWSPKQIAVEVWGLLANLGNHRKILALFRREPLKSVAETNPRLTLKYLAPYYLAMGLTFSERSSCFLHHYRRLTTTLTKRALTDVVKVGVTLCEVSEGENSFSLTLRSLVSPTDKDMEGEMTLSLCVNEEEAFGLSFTIVPGSVVRVDEEESLLITRLQGAVGRATQVKLATKAFKCGTPSSTLFAAIQGIGVSFGIRGIAAVFAENHNCYQEDRASHFKKAYDDVFIGLGMQINSAGFFSLPNSSESKSPRSRANHKNALRNRICAACVPLLSHPSASSAGSDVGMETDQHTSMHTSLSDSIFHPESVATEDMVLGLSDNCAQRWRERPSTEKIDIATVSPEVRKP